MNLINRDELLVRYADGLERWRKIAIGAGVVAVGGWVAFAASIWHGEGESAPALPRVAAPASKPEAPGVVMPIRPQLKFSGELVRGCWKVTVQDHPVTGKTEVAAAPMVLVDERLIAQPKPPFGESPGPADPTVDDGSMFFLASLLIRHRPDEGWTVYAAPNHGVTQILSMYPAIIRLDDGPPRSIRLAGMTNGAAALGGESVVRELLRHRRLGIQLQCSEEGSGDNATALSFTVDLSSLPGVVFDDTLSVRDGGR